MLDNLCQAADGDELLKKSRFNDREFTRRRKMPFKKLIFFMLNLVNSSSQVALLRFSEIIGDCESITQQAFSKARNKINHLPFLAFFKSTANDNPLIQRWNGYLLNAIDGSAMALPETEELRRYFGTIGAKSTSPTARGSIRLDILNDIICDAAITPYKTGERKTALEFLTRQDAAQGHINIYDRGYFSWDFAFSHIKKNIRFLCRLRTKFNTKIDSIPLGDHFLSFNINGRPIKVRIIKFLLDSGETETLITDIFDESLTTKDFKSLYFKRWSVETKYDIVKNKLAIENFSGLSPNCIKQDFFAAMTVANLVTAAKYDADNKIKQSRKGKNNKYTYVANVNSIIGIMKDHLILYCLFPNEPIGENAYKFIVKHVPKCVVPIRNNRKFPRDLPRYSKFHKNKKFNA